jgi:hypothetical protein
MGTGVPSPGVKRGRRVMLTTHPHLVPRSRMSRSYTSSLSSAWVACSGTALAWTSPKTPDVSELQQGGNTPRQDRRQTTDHAAFSSLRTLCTGGCRNQHNILQTSCCTFLSTKRVWHVQRVWATLHTVTERQRAGFMSTFTQRQQGLRVPGEDGNLWACCIREGRVTFTPIVDAK